MTCNSRRMGHCGYGVDDIRGVEFRNNHKDSQFEILGLARSIRNSINEQFLDHIKSHLEGNYNSLKEQGVKVKDIHEDGIVALQSVDWTGNIRELRNVLERLVILCDGEIRSEDVIRYANPK